MRQFTWRWPWQEPEPKPVRPPKVGGTRAPDTVHQIDFAEPHDFHFRFGHDKGIPLIFRRCVVVGYTTPLGDAAEEMERWEYAHSRWLVLRQEDGRLVYVPRESLLYIEEPTSDGSGSETT